MFARTQRPAVFKIIKPFLKQYFNDGKQLSAASQHLTLERTEEEIYTERFRFVSWLMSLIVCQLWDQKMKSWIQAAEMSLYLNKLVFG